MAKLHNSVSQTDGSGDGLSGGLYFIYGAVFLLALNGLFAKLIPLPAVTITQLRSFIAIWGFVVLAVVGRRSLRMGSLKGNLGVILLGALLGVHWATFFHAMQVSTVAIGMLALFSFPIITIFLEPFFDRRKLQPGDVLSGVLVLGGLAVMVSRDLNDLHGSVLQGVFWGVFSALLFVLRNLFQKYRFAGVPSDRLMFHQVCTVAVMLVPWVSVPELAGLPGTVWGKLVLLGLLSTASAHTLYSASLKRLPARSAALIGCLQPVIATLLAWLVVGEIPQPQVMVGGGIILAVAMSESLRSR